MSGKQLPQLVSAVTPLDDALREPTKRRRAPAKAKPKPVVAASFLCRCGYKADDQGDYQAHLRAEIEDLKSELDDFREGLPRRSDGKRLIAACGTVTGYRRHRRLGEPVCGACRAASSAWTRKYAAGNPAFREGVNARKRMRYAEDPEYRDRVLTGVKERSRQRYAEDPEYRDRILASNRESYARLRENADPEALENYRARDRERKRAARLKAG